LPTFFQRLAASGITADNTLFVFSAEENDQFAGANVGRAIVPSPAGCDGVTTPCQYAAGQIGEINTNLNGLLSAPKGNTTPFVVEPQGAVIYVNGQPAADELRLDSSSATRVHSPRPMIRTPERNPNEPIAAYLAGSVDQQILHSGQNRGPCAGRQRSQCSRIRTTTSVDRASCTPPRYQAPCVEQRRSAAPLRVEPRLYTPTIDVTWVGSSVPESRTVDSMATRLTMDPAVHHPNGDSTVCRL
jgi:hypothetical protein